MNVIISGAGGFIGSALAQGIKKHTVYKLKHSINFKHEGYEFLIDLTNPKHTKKLIKILKKTSPDIFFHFAAITPFKKSVRKAINYNDDIKIAGQVKNICERLKIPLLIFSSGWVVYGTKNRNPISEKATLNPRTDYGKSKLRQEIYFLKNLKKTKVVILRISSVFGPGQKTHGLIPAFVKSALEKRELKIMSKANRDYIYIEDLINILLRLIAKSITKNIILNVGSGKSINILKVAETIKKIMKDNYKINVKFNLLNPLKSEVPQDNQLDTSVLRNLIEMNDLYNFEKGILEYIKWYKKSL